MLITHHWCQVWDLTNSRLLSWDFRMRLVDCTKWLLRCVILEGTSLVTILADRWFSVLLDSWGAAADTHHKPEFASIRNEKFCDRPIMSHRRIKQ